MSWVVPFFVGLPWSINPWMCGKWRDDGSCWDEGGMGIFTDIHEYGTIKINGIHGSRYIYPWIPNGSVMDFFMPYLKASFAIMCCEGIFHRFQKKPTAKQRLSWIPYAFKALVPPDLAAHAAARGQCRIGRRTSPEFWVELRGCYSC